MPGETNVLLIISFLLAGTFNVVFPIILGWLIIRRRGTSWKLFGIGVLTFLGSQVFHLPAVAGLTGAFASGLLPAIPEKAAPFFNAVVLGLLAGLFEESARWIGYKILKKKGDSLDAALTLGTGHGGIEAIIVGFSVLAGLISMLMLKSSAAMLSALPPEQAEIAHQQMNAYWATPWHMPFAGAVERIAAVALHISLSMLVWMAVSLRKPLLYWAAVLYHAAVNAMAVLAVSFKVNPWLLEAVLVVIAFGGLWFVYQKAKAVDVERKSREAVQAQVELTTD